MRPEKATSEITSEWILQEVEKITYTYNLNKVVRYNLNREEELESQSVAEHVYNMLVLAHYFRDLEDPERKLDFEKVTKIILMHDMGEIETGDIIMSQKRDSHQQIESQAIDVVASKSPKFISEEIRHIYDEFENPQTLEGKFCKAIDKIEAQFWFTAVCADLKMIKFVTSIEERVRNEAKRRDMWSKLGFKVIEQFATTIDRLAKEKGLYE
jgi:5'-deoxynucleotidase YfbR-like HD superfamily hydrolase